MNVLYSGLYLIAVLGLLLTSVVVSEDLSLHNPSGVVMLFGVGLFVSLGFLLFGHIRFDELPDDEPEENPLRS